jgi:hypothetical protein
MYIKQEPNTYFADFIYNESVAGGVHTYTYVSANPNGDIIKDAVTPLLDYFSNNQFTISWYADPGTSIYPRVKFNPASGDYFLALLLP